MKSLKDTQKLVTQFNVKTGSSTKDKVLSDALNLQKNKNQHGTYNTRISKAAKFATAAVILILSLYSVKIIITNTNNPQPSTPTPAVVVENHPTPAQLTTLASFHFAYRKGGMQNVDQICEKVLVMAGPRPINTSLSDLLVEF